MHAYPPAENFTPGRVTDETRRIAERSVDLLPSIPRWQDIGAAAARRMREEGRGPFPPPARSTRGQWLEIPRAGDASLIRLRLIARSQPRGAYLHIHGGGWVLGAADHQDAALEALADATGLACLSVEYRLAPEHPFPAAVDDCVEAARWFARMAPGRYGEFLAIGGESAGAHLAALTLLRLRDENGVQPFRRANLTSGFYDLGLTPSARRFGEAGPVLRSSDCRDFVAAFLPEGIDPVHPSVSPLYADVRGMPPTLFSVGTNDPLLDDTLFFHARCLAAGGAAELAVYPGAVHGFNLFPSMIATEAAARVVQFLLE